MYGLQSRLTNDRSDITLHCCKVGVSADLKFTQLCHKILAVLLQKHVMKYPRASKFQTIRQTDPLTTRTLF